VSVPLLSAYIAETASSSTPSPFMSGMRAMNAPK
jgi:hypothetical protein